MQDALESPSFSRKNSWAFQLALCLLGPFFFLSVFFSIFAPLPALYLRQGFETEKLSRIWSLIAVFVGCALCGLIKGGVGALGFFLFASLPALMLGELLGKKKSPELAISAAALLVLFATCALGFGIAKSHEAPLIPFVRTELKSAIHEMSTRLIETQKGDLATESLEELKKIAENPNLLIDELPGILLSAILLLCTIPCVAMIRWNPKGFLRRSGIPRDFLRKWRSPEWLVWIALFCLAFLIFEVPYLSPIANNLLKPILLIYFFQGMSILAFFLDSLRIRGPIRLILYGFGIVFLTPMVISFGFFDLWFDFRRRRQDGIDEKDEEV